ncbi:MAG: hypothetical protein Ta2D_12360 [Rickettsiales bacterium]|nr:MAG: hypothetical protein Ta2D_12360 [Rickettsiales bacterium]
MVKKVKNSDKYLGRKYDNLRRRINDISNIPREQINSVLNLLKENDIVNYADNDEKQFETFKKFFDNEKIKYPNFADILHENIYIDNTNVKLKDAKEIARFFGAIAERKNLLSDILNVTDNDFRKELKKSFDKAVEFASLNFSQDINGSIRDFYDNGHSVYDYDSKVRLKELKRFQKNISLLDELIATDKGIIFNDPNNPIDTNEDDIKPIKPISPYLVVPDFNYITSWGIGNASTKINFLTTFFEDLEKIKELVAEKDNSKGPDIYLDGYLKNAKITEKQDTSNYDQISLLVAGIENYLNDPLTMRLFDATNALKQHVEKVKSIIFRKTHLTQDQMNMRVLYFQMKKIDDRVGFINDDIKDLTKKISNEEQKQDICLKNIIELRQRIDTTTDSEELKNGMIEEYKKEKINRENIIQFRKQIDEKRKTIQDIEREKNIKREIIMRIDPDFIAQQNSRQAPEPTPENSTLLSNSQKPILNEENSAIQQTEANSEKSFQKETIRIIRSKSEPSLSLLQKKPPRQQTNSEKSFQIETMESELPNQVKELTEQIKSAIDRTFSNSEDSEYSDSENSSINKKPKDKDFITLTQEEPEHNITEFLDTMQDIVYKNLDEQSQISQSPRSQISKKLSQDNSQSSSDTEKQKHSQPPSSREKLEKSPQPKQPSSQRRFKPKNPSQPLLQKTLTNDF